MEEQHCLDNVQLRLSQLQAQKSFPMSLGAMTGSLERPQKQVGPWWDVEDAGQQ